MKKNALPIGFELLGYRIESVLGCGGFAITYLATDSLKDKKVAIKEYLPGQLARRQNDSSVVARAQKCEKAYNWGLDQFIEEAYLLAKFNHPNIIRSLSVFAENRTAYMVMDYEAGHSLDQILKVRGRLNQDEVMSVTIPLLNGLAEIHRAEVIHRDIKPANIFIRHDGSPVLLDFGSAKRALSKKTHTLMTALTPGYAPYEQYPQTNLEEGPWTDIYALAATIYRAASGRSPSDAQTRHETIIKQDRDSLLSLSEFMLSDYEHDFVRAIEKGLELKSHRRPQNVGVWKELLDPHHQNTDAYIDTSLETKISGTETNPETQLLLNPKPGQQ